METKIDIRGKSITVSVKKENPGKNLLFGQKDLDFNKSEDFYNIQTIVKRLRLILCKNGVFRYEDLNLLSWNVRNFCYVSGSSYIKDGNYDIFNAAITELEKRVLEYSV